METGNDGDFGLAEIFERVIDLDPDEQNAALDDLCRGKPELRKQIDRLIAEDRVLQDNLLGATVGSYRIIGKLGQGGMGVVYAAEHVELGKRAVLKVLRAEFLPRRDIVMRFRAEAISAASIAHPGIVDVMHIDQLADGRLYMVMEHLAGETLRTRMDRVQTLPEHLAAAFIQQAARALAAAHGRGIVHRDLKPSNLFLVPDPEVPGGERVKILDFGIAKLMAAPDGVTLANTAMGTPPYMSPEQCIDAANVDHRADLYALGVILFEMICGKLPFEGRSFAEYVLAHVHAPLPAMHGFSPELVDIVATLLAKDRDARYGSALELIAALQNTALVPDETVSPSSSEALGRAATTLQGAAVEVAQAAWHKPRRKRRLALGGAGVAALGAIIAVLAAGRGPDRPSLPPLPVDMEVVEAVRLTRASGAADVLYRALEQEPPLSIAAARALRDLGLPDAAARIRAALGRHGGELRVELAACLVTLGDSDAVHILQKSLAHEAMAVRLTAALALAEARKEDTAQPVLAAIFDELPPGREFWRQAARGLRALGDARAQEALRRELARPEEEWTRAIRAADILALENDPMAHGYLQRRLRDRNLELRGSAAVILAGAGEPAALRFVATGLDSPEPTVRRLAIAVAARLARLGGDRHEDRIFALATGDKDRMVRITAQVALTALAGGSAP